jgi:hypothetical protein
VKFASDLLYVLDSDTPPTIEWFKTMPAYEKHITTDNRRWAIYVVVLEKDECRHKIYIRSGTNSKEGVHSRIMNYE